MTGGNPTASSEIGHVEVPAPETKAFAGAFLLYRKKAGHIVRPGVRSQAREPRFRHPTFEAAEAEAVRLLTHHPESTFVIMQEVGRVKYGERTP